MNIVNQQGVFTWNVHPVASLEEIATQEYENERNSLNQNTDYRFSYCININKKLVPYIEKKLLSLGITDDFIYPDPKKIASQAFEKSKSDVKN